MGETNIQVEEGEYEEIFVEETLRDIAGSMGFEIESIRLTPTN